MPRAPAACDRPGPSRLPAWYNLVILPSMKTAVSLPDALFAEAERVAERLGLSRSELYARAITAFVREHSGEVITATIDRVLLTTKAPLDPELARMQSRSLGTDEGSFEDWVAPSSSAGRTGARSGTSRASERRKGSRSRG